MTVIRFRVDRKEIQELPEKDFEAFEMALDGNLKMYRLRPLFARYVIDENNKPVPYLIALARLGAIPTKEWSEKVIIPFSNALMETAVPNQKGSASNSPSEVGQEKALPDGQQP